MVDDARKNCISYTLDESALLLSAISTISLLVTAMSYTVIDLLNNVLAYVELKLTGYTHIIGRLVYRVTGYHTIDIRLIVYINLTLLSSGYLAAC